MNIRWIVFAMLFCSMPVNANDKTIDNAIMEYYAGSPEVAISMIEPLAASGNLDAQLLLGNILYSLARSGSGDSYGDPLGWYERAAAQNSADANYTLGAIYNNRWLETRDKQDAARGIVYYQRALELGHNEAQLRSTSLETRSGVSSGEAASLAAGAVAIRIAALDTGMQDSMTEVAAESDSAANDSTAPAMAVIALEETASPPVPVAEPSAVPEVPQVSEETAEIEAAEEPIALAEPAPEASAGPIEISLDEVAENCRRYTSAGFELYAETIRGGLLSGRAKTYSIRPDLSDSEHRSIKLTYKGIGIALLLDLDAVPTEVAADFRQGEEHGITGLIVDSQAFGSSCSLSLQYQASSG